MIKAELPEFAKGKSFIKTSDKLIKIGKELPLEKILDTHIGITGLDFLRKRKNDNISFYNKWINRISETSVRASHMQKDWNILLGM
jgi:hypothetical protein